MSWQAVQAVIECSNVKGAALLTLVVVAERANKDGVAWPSVRDISRRAKQSCRQVERHLRTLIEAGELTIVKRGGGYRKTNHYRIAAIKKNPGENNGASDSTNPGVSTTNHDVLGAQPRHLRRKTPAKSPEEPAVTREEPSASADAPERSPDGIADAAALPASGAATAADPDAELFNRQLLERRADTARAAGARTPRPAGSALAAALGVKPRRQKGRIPDDEQRRAFELLRQVPRLNEDDARDLARVAPCADFKAAIARMNGNIRNPGGWLRTFVEHGYGQAGA